MPLRVRCIACSADSSTRNWRRNLNHVRGSVAIGGLVSLPPGPHVLAGATPLATLVAESPDLLQLTIFATSLGLWRAVRDSGTPVGALVGMAWTLLA